MSVTEGLIAFKLTDKEWDVLQKKLVNLARFAAWQLLGKNMKNSHTDEFCDLEQELLQAMWVSALYFKRQTYIGKSLSLLKDFVKDDLMSKLVDELLFLWENKTRHGAGKQKFGPPQEEMLEKLLNQFVPEEERPSKQAEIEVNQKMINYVKRCCWNLTKFLGKKITKERSIRNGMVSLSENGHLLPSEMYEQDVV